MNNQRGKISYFDRDVIGRDGFTWNPTTGCTFGCPECWARGVAQTRLAPSILSRVEKDARAGGFVRKDGSDNFSDCVEHFGTIVEKRQYEAYRTFTPTLHPERLDEPARRKKPAVIGVCFMGDLLDPYLDRYCVDRIRHPTLRVLDEMDKARQHTYVLLTKRPENMAYRLKDAAPQDNWILGASCRNQKEFDRNWKHLAKLAAAGWKVWVSLEPMQGSVDLGQAISEYRCYEPEEDDIEMDKWRDVRGFITPDYSFCNMNCDFRNPEELEQPRFDSADKCIHSRKHPRLSGVILGAQSGKNAVTLDPDWVRSVERQCRAAGVPFMFKQDNSIGKVVTLPELDGKRHTSTAWTVEG